MMPQWIQGSIIALAVMWSVLHLLRKYFPRQIKRLRAGCAATMIKSSQPLVVRRVGIWLQRSETNDDGCDSGCGGCSGCAANPKAPPRKDEQHPLRFHRRP